ncbi:MAG: LamG domain-containing protein, partial [Myxococcota bacterium]
MRRSTILGVLVALLVLATSAYAQDEEATTFTPLVLDGQTSIEVEPSPALALGEASTIEFWIATAWEDEDGVESFPAVLGRREPYEGSEPEGFAAATQYSVHLTPDRQAIGLFDGTRFASVPFDFSDGRLHHVALVTEGDRTTIYVDREARGTVEVGLGEPSELPLHVGSSDGGSELFMGVLPSVRLWRSALTAEQVGAIAEVLGAPEDEGAPLDDLVAYSDFTGEAPEIVVLEDVAAPETSAVPELPTATPAVEVETRGLGDKIRKSKLKKKEKKLQEKVTKNEGELAQRQQAAARVRGRLRQYQNARPVRNKRIDMGGFSFTVGSVRVGDQVVGAGTAARRQRKLAKRLAKLDGEIADYTEKLDGPPSYGKNGARRGLRQKLGDTQNKLAALGGNAPAPKPPLRRTKAKQDLTADTNADDSASPPARPRRNWKKKPTPDNEVPDVGDIVQVGKNKKNLVAVAKQLKGGAFADVFVIEDPQGDKAILKQQKAWPKQAKEGMKDNYGEYKDRV